MPLTALSVITTSSYTSSPGSTSRLYAASCRANSVTAAGGVVRDSLKAALKAIPLSDDRKYGLARRLRIDRTIAVSVGRYTEPAFLILGAQKSGTTSLYRYLTAHPSVKPALRKEIHYFDLNFERGRNWYLTHFPSRVPPGSITGEATPYYLFHPAVPRRVADMLPDARLVAVLRNPVDRAYSHYAHSVKHGLETSSFEDALARELKLIGDGARLAEDVGDDYSHQHHTYMSRGLYAQQLDRWYSLYRPEQILVLKSEDLSNHPAAVVQRTVEFLRLSSSEVADLNYPRLHQGTYGSAMSPKTREMLQEFFRPHNQDLAATLDFDISDWAQSR
ncbi:sulfotransferase domain-containing protein [Mycobacterium sp. OAE908]|uniref:sulfotransferase domain-containing protein n=1 Tax=Mycobacterium sp. OAE908 TaxID=2817899 RepID=UPI001AE491CC